MELAVNDPIGPAQESVRTPTGAGTCGWVCESQSGPGFVSRTEGAGMYTTSNRHARRAHRPSLYRPTHLFNPQAPSR